ncbi:MAG: ATP-binding cassette domain-containing protein, partial [Acidobacteriota bacterium]|nr:ATP-binding cassette domain-containing protein [Acidobacteriota bacterium]
MIEPRIRCEHLNKVFSGSRSRVARFLLNRPPADVEAVRDITFAVGPGEILGIMGPNGAGKTTLVKMLCTLLIPTSGAASICDLDVTRYPGRVRENIAF